MSRQITCMGSDTRGESGLSSEGHSVGYSDLNRHHVGHAGHGAEQRVDNKFHRRVARDHAQRAQRAQCAQCFERLQRLRDTLGGRRRRRCGGSAVEVDRNPRDEDLWRGPRRELLRRWGCVRVALAREQ